MPDTGCAAVVLAAGASTRLGQAKQLIELDGESLLRRTARLALEAGCAPVVVVLGYEAERIAAELTDLSVEPVVNPEWRQGMGSSLRCGVAAPVICRIMPTNILLLVCDQPRLTVDHLRALLAHHAAESVAITASQYAGRMGVPAVFAAGIVPELLQCTGDQGARELIRLDATRVQLVPWPGGAIDIDRPEDREDLTGS
ncbi:MAG: nucleotidyltransferase family protein [Acidobacteriaceae bacterium]